MIIIIIITIIISGASPKKDRYIRTRKRLPRREKLGETKLAKWPPITKKDSKMAPI